MKLQKLTIHNIASIEDAFIDFDAEPLADSDVFLITGDTGSGKSTILDAICLALYADTPRLDNTKMQGKITDGEVKNMSVGDPRHLLRRNTGEGFVELTFKTFKDNKDVHYKAKWEVHRAHDKADGRLQSKKWTLTDEDTGYSYVGDDEITPVIAKVVGLTFDQFCRTTLLAQGEFTRFLNSNDQDKAGILEKITGTDSYKKIGSKIYDITAEKKNLLAIATSNVGQITLLSDEIIADKKNKLADCDTRYKALKTERDNANAKLLWIKKETELKETIATAEKNCNKANEVVETDEFKAKVLQVTQWNDTIDARGWLTALNKAEAEKEQQSRKLEGLKADYLKVLAGYAFEEQKRKLTEEKLKTLLQVDDNEGNAAQNELKELRKQRDNAKELQRNIKTAEERIEALEREKERRKKASDNLTQTLNDIKEIKEAVEGMNPKIAEARKIRDDREMVYEKQKDTVENFAKLMRQKLHVGDTCPVCGQTVTDELPHEEELAKLVENLSRAFKEAKDAFDKLDGEQKALIAKKEALEKTYSLDKVAFDKDTSVADALQRVNGACKACDIEAFDETITPQRLQTLKDNADVIIEQLNNEIPSLEEKVNTYIETTKERTQLTGKLAKINGILDTVRKAVDAIREDMPDWKELKPVAVAELEEMSLEATDVRAKVQTAVTMLGTASSTAASNQDRLERYLDVHPEITLERLAALNAVKPADIVALNKEVNDSRSVVSRQNGALQQAKENREQHLKTKPELKEEDTLEQLTSLVEGLDLEMGEVNKEKGGIEQELKTDAENVEKHGKLVKEKERFEADYNRWNRLNEFLGDKDGNKFNKIAQSYILGSLIHSANHYIQNLYDRYTLKVVPGTFVIMIEDAYQGYASRVASTISGGESFLVSLALALALSDIGDRLAVDTLFIDEGFGTLSGAPLQNAIDTLRKLHSQSGRHVGIISHVEELKDSIATQIQVTQSPKTGSSYIEITTR